MVRRSDVSVLVAVAFAAGAAWLYLFIAPMPAMPGGSVMSGMRTADMTIGGWSWREGLLLFGMWAMMMAAMMLPSASPMLLLFSRISAHRRGSGSRSTPVAFFAAGYLLVWVLFSAIAALLQ